MVKGITIREQHFPGRAPVDAYGNGGFRFADMSHRGSILCLPSGIYGWPVEEGMPIDVESLAKLFADAAGSKLEDKKVAEKVNNWMPSRLMLPSST